jgi:hypothetical protein
LLELEGYVESVDHYDGFGDVLAGYVAQAAACAFVEVEDVTSLEPWIRNTRLRVVAIVFTCRVYDLFVGVLDGYGG